MNSEYLRYLIEIHKCRSISVAAQQLFLSQTTLSATLRSVEEELGFEIFRRTRTGVQVTAEGEEALTLISEISHRLDEIHQLRDQPKGTPQTVNIITSPTICSGLALPIYEAFKEKDPTANLTFCAVSGEEVGTKLIKNEGHIGLTYFSEHTLSSYRSIATKYQIHSEPVFMDGFYLVVSATNPLAHNDSISCKDLVNLHFASLPSYIGNTEGLLAQSRYLGEGNRFTTFSDIALIKKAILELDMVAILSGFAIQYNNSCDRSRFKAIRLTEIPLENKMLLCLICRSERDLRYHEKLVIHCIKEYFQNLKQPPFAYRALKNAKLLG